MSRPNPDWVPTHELLEIFLATEQAHPATRGQQLCVKAHAELCRRIQAPAYIPIPKEASVPVPSYSESSQSDSPESGTTKPPKPPMPTYSKFELDLWHQKALTDKNLETTTMLNLYAKPGVVISEEKLLKLLRHVAACELLLLQQNPDKQYSPTAANIQFVRGWLAAKGYGKYVL